MLIQCIYTIISLPLWSSQSAGVAEVQVPWSEWDVSAHLVTRGEGTDWNLGPIWWIRRVQLEVCPLLCVGCIHIVQHYRLSLLQIDSCCRYCHGEKDVKWLCMKERQLDFSSVLRWLWNLRAMPDSFEKQGSHSCSIFWLNFIPASILLTLYAGNIHVHLKRHSLADVYLWV